MQPAHVCRPTRQGDAAHLALSSQDDTDVINVHRHNTQCQGFTMQMLVLVCISLYNLAQYHTLLIPPSLGKGLGGLVASV